MPERPGDNSTRRGPRVHLIGLYSPANIGDAAIVGGLLEVLARVRPDAEVSLSTFDPETARELFELEAVPALGASAYLGSEHGLLLQAAHWRRVERRSRDAGADGGTERLEALGPSLGPLRRADAVIGVGGTYLNDNYRRELPGRLWELWLAKRLGKPVALVGHSLGPFRGRLYRQAFRRVVRRLDLVTVRDDRSLRLVVGAGPRVARTGDTAFCLTPRAREAGLRHLAAEGIPEAGGQRIGLSVRAWPFYGAADPAALAARYEAEMTALCDRLTERPGRQVVLVSTCSGHNGYTADDRVPAARIRKGMRRPERAVVVQGFHPPSDLAAMLGCLDLHIGTRMHSNILALLAGTPVVGIAYEFKTTELFAQMGMADLCFPIESVEGARVAQVAEALLGAPEAARRRAGEALAAQRQRAWENADLLARYLPGEAR